MKIKTFLLFWLPVALWAGVIYLFSSFPTLQTSEEVWQNFVIKKTAHLIEFALLSLLLYRAFKKTTKETLKRIFLITLILVILYAISDEYHQSFISGRTATVRDVFIDSLGAILALFCLWKLLPKAPRKLKNWAKNWQLL